MEIVLVGTVEYKSTVDVISENFFKQSIQIKDQNDQYPQYFEIEFHKDKTSLLDSISVGSVVQVSINLRGRKWINNEGKTRIFHTFVGWKIKEVQQKTDSLDPYKAHNKFMEKQTAVDSIPSDDEDLPF